MCAGSIRDWWPRVWPRQGQCPPSLSPLPWKRTVDPGGILLPFFPLHPVILGKGHFLPRGTEAKKKQLFGDLGSCFRAKMVLGPTGSQDLRPPTSTEHGTLGWGESWEPFVITRILSPLCPLFPLLSCTFNQGEGVGKDTFPSTLGLFWEGPPCSSREGRFISPSARAGTPRGSQTTGTCVAPIPLPLPRTPPSEFSMFSQGGLTSHGREELPGPLPRLLHPPLSPLGSAHRRHHCQRQPAAPWRGTVPGKKSPRLLSPWAQLPSGHLQFSSQLGTRNLTASVSIVYER